MPSSPAQPIAAIAALLLLAGCEANTAPAPNAERPVQTQRVAFERANAAREFVGVVRARRETDLGFRVAGKITKRAVNVGDRVRAGDIVASLDPRDIRLQVESAEAELAAATSTLAQTSSDFARYETLKERGFASAAEYDRKKSAKAEAEARHERAQRALEIARNQLAYADLRADADGVITATLAEVGQVVAIGQPVVRLTHHGEKEAVIALPETWLEEARTSAASVRLWSDSGRRYDARLRELSPQADAATRTYAARFTIDNADDAVALGMTATVQLSPVNGDRVARLPLSAVFNRGSGPSVYRVDQSGTLALQPVTVAAFTEAAALVTAGVQDGDKIVTLGVQKLQPGLKVRTIEAAAQQSRREQ